jgi:tetratricopeptide (TPR) repeat protein
MTSVDELKAIGNVLMQRNEPKQAAVAFTKALQLDATNKLLLSNRSAAFLKMGRASRALQDADAAIAVDGTWLKAHFRRLQAQIAMNVAPDQLLITARRALEIDANAPEFIAIIKVSRTETVVSLSLTHSLTLKNKKKYDINDYNANFASKLSAVVPEPSPSPAVSVTTPVVVPSAVPPVSVIDPSFVQNPKFITARKTVDEVLQQFDETVAGKVPVHLAKLQSTVFFLPVADIPLPVINVSQAFASPEMLAQCVQFLREAAQRDQILGSCSVVQRSVIAFPQVWKGRAKTDFPFDESVDGIFITIESATTEGAVEYVGQRIVHFMPMVPDANGVVHFSREHVVALDPDWCALMPRLLK